MGFYREGMICQFLYPAPTPASLKSLNIDDDVARQPASHAINIVFHVKHTRRTRHTAAAPVPSASMLPHFAQLPPGAAPHSKRGPRTPSPSAPHTQTPTSQPQHLSTYALSSFQALDAINVAELELRAPGCNQPTSAYERNHRD